MMFSNDIAMVTKKATQGAKTHPICKSSSNLTKAYRMNGIDFFFEKKKLKNVKLGSKIYAITNVYF